MNKKYKLVRSLPELIVEVSHNADVLHRRTRWLTAGLVIFGFEFLMASRLIAKQEEAICDLTNRVKELESVYDKMNSEPGNTESVIC